VGRQGAVVILSFALERPQPENDVHGQGQSGPTLSFALSAAVIRKCHVSNGMRTFAARKKRPAGRKAHAEPSLV